MARYDHQFCRYRWLTAEDFCYVIGKIVGLLAFTSRRCLDVVIRYGVLIHEPHSFHDYVMENTKTDKRQRLLKSGTLNRSPENVHDPMFADDDFFDASDLLQVRYEMVRLVRIGKATLAEAAQRFGVSRPTCFRMTRAFDMGGLQGLIPAPRGPRGPHKVTPEILRLVDDYRARHGRVGARRLVSLIETEFGVRLHPRGLEKALARVQKKTPEAGT